MTPTSRTLADGILGHVLDLRVVVTTNAKKIEIDPALLRPGRLASRIEVARFSEEFAASVYERLKGEAAPKLGRSTLAEVYQAAR